MTEKRVRHFLPPFFCINFLCRLRPMGIRFVNQPIYIVDAFAERPFQGNPAAVCPLEAPADAEWMQRVAGEMNLSETAFTVPNASGFDLRWFTPRVEVDLCGHATLATAHLLWEQGFAPTGKPIRFQTHSGELTCRQADNRIEL